jgi:hypothetical protein
VLNAKPRLSPWPRQLLVERVLAGRLAAHFAAEMGVSRATAYKWLARFRPERLAGLPTVRAARIAPRVALIRAWRLRSRRCVASGCWPGPDRRDLGIEPLDRSPGAESPSDGSSVVDRPAFRRR